MEKELLKDFPEKMALPKVHFIDLNSETGTIKAHVDGSRFTGPALASLSLRLVTGIFLRKQDCFLQNIENFYCNTSSVKGLQIILMRYLITRFISLQTNKHSR